MDKVVNTCITRQNITETIRAILRDKLRVDGALLTEANDSEPLTGGLFDLRGRDLAYLLAFVKEAFAIEIPGAELADEGFNSVSSIAGIVERAAGEAT